MQILGCQKNDLKMFSIAKSACLRYIMRKNLKNFPGAAPPDPCRSSIGALRAASRSLRSPPTSHTAPRCCRTTLKSISWGFKVPQFKPNFSKVKRCLQQV